MRGLRTKRIRTVKEGTLIATVDIGLSTNTGYCTTIDGRDIKVFKFGNTKEGFEKFWHMIVAAQNRFKCTGVIVGYESTGPYAEPLVHYLMDKPVSIVQVNPLHTKRLKEVNDNSPGKTDDKDSRVIADIIRLGRALSIVVPEGDAAYLRRLNKGGGRDVASFCTLSLMGIPISLLNRPGDRCSGDPEMPGNFRCRNAKLGSCPVGDRSSGFTRSGASAAALHLPDVDLPFATFLVDEMEHVIGGPDLDSPALRVFRLLEHRHDEFTASEDSLVPFFLCTMSSERGHLRPSPETADKASPHEVRLMTHGEPSGDKAPVSRLRLSSRLAEEQQGEVPIHPRLFAYHNAVA